MGLLYLYVYEIQEGEWLKQATENFLRMENFRRQDFSCGAEVQRGLWPPHS